MYLYMYIYVYIYICLYIYTDMWILLEMANSDKTEHPSNKTIRLFMYGLLHVLVGIIFCQD